METPRPTFREQSIALPSSGSIPTLVTREAVDAAIGHLVATDIAIKEVPLDPAYINPGLSPLTPDQQREIGIRSSAAQRLRVAIVDRVVEAYIGEQTEGGDRIREIAARAGGIDEDVERIIDGGRELAKIVTPIRAALENLSPRASEMDDDALITVYLPSLPVAGTDTIVTQYALRKTMLQLAKNSLALTLLQGHFDDFAPRE